MHKDVVGNEILEGCLVRILEPEKTWFDYLPNDAYLILQNACKEPLKVEYLDDDEKVSLILPPTLDIDGDYVGNSISLKSKKVIVVQPIS